MTTPIPPKDLFPKVMEHTIRLTAEKVPPKSVQSLAKIFTTLCWEFPDYQLSVYTLLDDEGNFTYAESLEGQAQAQITMDARQLHSIVYQKASMPKMFLTGQIKVRGLPTLKLIKFVPLLGPFLDSYKEACENIQNSPPRA